MRSRRWRSRPGPAFWSRAGSSAKAVPGNWPPIRRCAISFLAARHSLCSPAILEGNGVKIMINRRIGHARIGRRAALLGGVAAVAAPSVVIAQSDQIKIATLTPLTGAGGSYGPVMAKVAAAVVEEVNAADGVLGRKIVLVSEDDQTNPDAGVRAARKLIDVDKVSAIMGTWPSSVTTAVAPLCWESKTFLCTVSGADSITLLPHQGFLVRTQPNTVLQITRAGEFLISMGVKKAYTLVPQTPFAKS